MEDILKAHAERVEQANAALTAEVERIRNSADSEMRERIATFGHRAIEIIRTLDDARATCSQQIEGILANATSSLAAAFAGNAIELLGSNEAMKIEISTRIAFMATGALPAPDPLPNVNDAPKLPAPNEEPAPLAFASAPETSDGKAPEDQAA